MRWYLRFGLSYRDVEELLADRGVEVDHTTVLRWVARFTPLFVEAARPCRHTSGDRWFVDETYVKVRGRWRYLYRAVDQFGQVVDVLLSPNRDQKAARRFFTRALAGATGAGRDDHRPGGGLPAGARRAAARRPARHRALREQPGRGRPRPAQGTAATHARAETGPLGGIVATGPAFVQNLRRGHYELATEAAVLDRVPVAFTELALTI